MSATELIDFRHQPIQKITVVTDADKRAVEVLEGSFEHILGLHIQVIRRLIENEQVAGFEQETNHRQTTAFSS